MGKIKLKPLMWIPGTKEDLNEMPYDVKVDFGYGLYQAQKGEFPDSAKPLSGFGSAKVAELVDNFMGDTYRAVYTIQFEDVVFVLHVFKKKSHKGKETPKPDLELIRKRIQRAKVMYQEWKKEKR